jgi:hydroxypyruvate isomerase
MHARLRGRLDGGRRRCFTHGRVVEFDLDLIAHLHAAGHPGRHDLWEGELNYKYIFDAIDKAGYSGSCGMEYGILISSEESLKRAMSLYGAKA